MDEVPVRRSNSPPPSADAISQEPHITPTIMSRKTGWSVPYCSMMLNGVRKVPLERATRIYELTGAKIGPLKDANDAEIATLCRYTHEHTN